LTVAGYVSVSTHPSGDRLLVSVDGDLDVETRGWFASVVAEAMTEETRIIEIDVGAVELCDSSGLGALVGLHRAAAVEHKHLYVSHCARGLERLLRVTGLLYLTQTEPDAEVGGAEADGVHG
jgi:anti-sigma B factor antagonist